jgi:hypothetical protein
MGDEYRRTCSSRAFKRDAVYSAIAIWYAPFLVEGLLNPNANQAPNQLKTG